MWRLVGYVDFFGAKTELCALFVQVAIDDLEREHWLLQATHSVLSCFVVELLLLSVLLLSCNGNTSRARSTARARAFHSFRAASKKLYWDCAWNAQFPAKQLLQLGLPTQTAKLGPSHFFGFQAYSTTTHIRTSLRQTRLQVHIE